MDSSSTHDVHQASASDAAKQVIGDTQQDAPAHDENDDRDDYDGENDDGLAARPVKRRRKTRRVA